MIFKCGIDRAGLCTVWAKIPHLQKIMCSILYADPNSDVEIKSTQELLLLSVVAFFKSYCCVRALWKFKGLKALKP